MPRLLAILLFVALGSSGCERTDCFSHCSDRREQICGNDGRTYESACWAQCDDVDVDYAGPCREDDRTED